MLTFFLSNLMTQANLEECPKLLFELFAPEQVVFFHGQFEMCPTTLRPHLQAYAYWESPKTFTQIQGFCQEGTHIEPRKGTHHQAMEYVAKDDTRIAGPFSIGTEPAQGKRSDLDRVKELIDNGSTMLEVVNEHFGAFVCYSKGFEKYKRLLVPQQRNWKTEVFYYFGPPGTGKTHEVYKREGYENVYSKPRDTQNGGPWFDGYDGQEVILLDDFYSALPYSFLLNLLDAYPLLANTKGSMVNLIPKRIYITFNIPLEEQYRNKRAEIAALERRVENIVEFTRERTNFIQTVIKPDPLADVALRINRELFSALEEDEIEEIPLLPDLNKDSL